MAAVTCYGTALKTAISVLTARYHSSDVIEWNYRHHYDRPDMFLGGGFNRWPPIALAGFYDVIDKLPESDWKGASDPHFLEICDEIGVIASDKAVFLMKQTRILSSWPIKIWEILTYGQSCRSGTLTFGQSCRSGAGGTRL